MARLRPPNRFVAGHGDLQEAEIVTRPGARSWWPVWACSLVLVAILLWPLTHPGYLLGHDMVFTPRQPLGPASIGVSSAAPRAVPLDALVALLERVADGAVVGRLALVLPLLAVAAGSALVLGECSMPGRLAAVSAATWNPFVVERLALGQWALLWSYAALPWIVLAVRRWSGRAGWAALAAAIAAGSITPTGGILATATTVAVVFGCHRPRRDVLGAVALAVALQLPWLLPALVSTATATSDPAGVTTFSARAEHPGGTVLSLVGGGGIWDAEVVPASRSGALPFLWLAVLVAAAWFGGRPLAARLSAPLLAALATLAGVAFLVAAAPAFPGGTAALQAVVENLPGAGILRDGQKWVLPLVLLEALLVGAAVDRIAVRARSTPWRATVAVAAVVIPVLALPDAAATLRPTLRPVHYPHDWAAISQHLGSGDAAVAPWGSYRTFPWARGRSVLDPAPRLLPVPTVVDDRLAVSGRLLSGEDRRAAAVGRALSGGAGLAGRLRNLGVSWLVVERHTPGPVPDVSGLTTVWSGRDVALFRVPGPVRDDRPAAGRVVIVLIGDAVAIAVLLALLGWAVGPNIARTTRLTARRRASPPMLE